MDAPNGRPSHLCSSGGWRDSDLFLLAGTACRSNKTYPLTMTVEFENVSAFGESIKINYNITGYDLWKHGIRKVDFVIHV